MNQKRIIILTHSLRYNYGGILQNYALQKTLSRLGYYPITLKTFRKNNLLDVLKYLYINMKNFLLGGRIDSSFLLEKQIKAICINTDDFITKNIEMSPSMRTINKKWMRKQKIDAIIVGSDQVLHPLSYPKIEEVFLNFIQNKNKILYAASFGFDKWIYSLKQTQVCGKLLKDFKAVSVRENKAVEFMEQYFGKTPQLLLDPTLLLDMKDYEEILHSEGLVACKDLGVVVYYLDADAEKNNIVEKVAHKLNMNVHAASNLKMDNSKYNPSDRTATGVETWLYRMKNAKFIITDSYHGTLFALIFRKPFITIGNKKRGLNRFTSILSTLGLLDRLIINTKDVSIESILTNEINYCKVYSVLKKHQKESISFLKQNLP